MDIPDDSPRSFVRYITAQDRVRDLDGPVNPSDYRLLEPPDLDIDELNRSDNNSRSYSEAQLTKSSAHHVANSRHTVKARQPMWQPLADPSALRFGSREFYKNIGMVPPSNPCSYSGDRSFPPGEPLNVTHDAPFPSYRQLAKNSYVPPRPPDKDCCNTCSCNCKSDTQPENQKSVSSGEETSDLENAACQCRNCKPKIKTKQVPFWTPSVNKNNSARHKGRVDKKRCVRRACKSEGDRKSVV